MDEVFLKDEDGERERGRRRGNREVDREGKEVETGSDCTCVNASDPLSSGRLVRHQGPETGNGFIPCRKQQGGRRVRWWGEEGD